MEGRRRLLSLWLALWMCASAATVAAQCSFPFTPPDVAYDFSTPEFRDLFAELDVTTSSFAHDNGVSSYAVAVVHGNRTIYSAGLTATPFRCASITKTFTALGALILRERGLLSLDDPVNKFLPGFSVVNPYGRHNTTLRELMAHVSGLPMQFCPFRHECTGDEDEILAQIAGMALVQPPWGRQPVYSNLGIALLGHAWEKATRPRVSWWQFLQAAVVGPLGMTATGVDLVGVDMAPNSDAFAMQDLSWSAPAAQMYSTAEDLAKYLGFVITGSPALISDATRREWVRPVKLFADGSGGYAMPWELRRLARNVTPDFVVGKAGDINGYRSNVGIHQATQLGVVVLTVYRDPFRPAHGPDALVDAVLTALIPRVQDLNNASASQTFAGVYSCAPSAPFASPTQNDTVAVLGGTITVSSNRTQGLSAALDVNLRNGAGGAYTAAGANLLLLKNATEGSFWFGDGAVCYWYLGGLSAAPDLRVPNTPGSVYTNELRFDSATSSVLWPTVGANCTKSS